LAASPSPPTPCNKTSRFCGIACRRCSGPREFYATRSAKALLLDFSSFSSYRTTARVFNRVRRSFRQNCTPVTTIASFVHREGMAVHAYLGHFVTSTLAQHQLTPDGVPYSESNPVYQRPLAEAKYTRGDYSAIGSPRPGWNITPIKPWTAKFPRLRWTRSTKISMGPSIFPLMTWASKNRRLSAAFSIRRRRRPHLPRRSASHPTLQVRPPFCDPRIPR